MSIPLNDHVVHHDNVTGNATAAGTSLTTTSKGNVKAAAMGRTQKDQHHQHASSVGFALDETTFIEEKPTLEERCESVASQRSVSSTQSVRGVQIREHTVTLRQLLKFAFPHNVNKSARLFVLAEDGPLYQQHSFISCLCAPCQATCRDRRKTDPLCRAVFDNTALLTPAHATSLKQWACPKCVVHVTHAQHLKGGRGGRHVVNDAELQAMAQRLDNGDVLRAYGRSMLTRAEEREFLHSVAKQVRRKL
jgi:hypothetical protein